MILYLDTSSLLKLHLDEDHAAEVRAWAATAGTLATSRLSHAEAMAALARRRRDATIPSEICDLLGADLTAAWPNFLRLEIDELAAGQLAMKHDLCGADAVQLAAALALRPLVEEGVELAFTSFDVRQLAAARAEGLRVLEPDGV